MALGASVFILAILVISIWLIIEFKRMKHKIFAILLIGLIILTYVSFAIGLKDHKIDLTSVSGVMEAGKLYFAWLSGVFTNLKSITAYAFKQNWSQYDEKVLNTSIEPEFIGSKEK
jgi:MFS superfamily sulfate permease-like transporter